MIYIILPLCANKLHTIDYIFFIILQIDKVLRIIKRHEKLILVKLFLSLFHK